MPIDEQYERTIRVFLADIEEAERMVPMNPAMTAIKTMTSHYLNQKSIGKAVFEISIPEPKKSFERQKVTIEEIGNTL
jgi:hypothetical protein